MKVIKKGKLRLTTCPYCETVLQYDIYGDVKSKEVEVLNAMDLRSKQYRYIICPICNQEIDITNEVE